MSKRATDPHVDTTELVDALRQFIDRNYPNVTNAELYEAVVDVYADVARDNNAQATEQVNAALSSVFGNARFDDRGAELTEHQHELGL